MNHELDFGSLSCVLLPLMPTLIRLTLRSYDGYHDHIQVGRILRDCPQMEHLHISRGYGLERLSGPWIPLVPSSTAPNGSYFAPVSLKSFVIEGTSFELSVLLTFLAFAPCLKELRVFDVRIGGSPYSDSFEHARVSQHLRSLWLPLDSFHFSVNYRSYDNELMPDLVHHSREQSFWSCDIQNDPLRTIRQVPSNPTTVELVPMYGYEIRDNPLASSALHNYLCSSPHLLHLKVPKICYSIAHMDLHGRLAELLAHPSVHCKSWHYRKRVSYPSGIWQCRNLKTLHIRIFTLDKRSGEPPEPYLEFGRVAFGYIARVCPNIRDIALSNGPYQPNVYQVRQVSQPPLDLRLQRRILFAGPTQAFGEDRDREVYGACGAAATEL